MRYVMHDQITLEQLCKAIYTWLYLMMPKEKRIAVAHHILKMDEQNLNGS